MKKQIVFFVAALSLFGVAAIDLYLWISISVDPSKSFQQVKDDYLSRFPEAIQSALLITLGNIILLSGAAILFYKSQTANRTNRTGILSKAFLIISLILLSWQIFSLM